MYPYPMCVTTDDYHAPFLQGWQKRTFLPGKNKHRPIFFTNQGFPILAVAWQIYGSTGKLC